MRTKEFKMCVELLHTMLKYGNINSEERVLFTEITNKLQPIFEKTEKPKTYEACLTLVENLKDIHQQLKQNKKIKLDLSKFENYYDRYIATTLIMMPLANSCPKFDSLIIVAPDKTVSLNFLQKELCETGIPMLAYQILGAMTMYVINKVSNN